MPARRIVGISQGSILPGSADTGLRVKKGQHIKLTVGGAVVLKRKSAPKNGSDALVSAIGEAGKRAEQRVEGQQAQDFVARQSGNLFVGINDSSSEDNSGELTVEIRVE